MFVLVSPLVLVVVESEFCLFVALFRFGLWCCRCGCEFCLSVGVVVVAGEQQSQSCALASCVVVVRVCFGFGLLCLFWF